MMMTMIAVVTVSLRVGQTTFAVSFFTWLKKTPGLTLATWLHLLFNNTNKAEPPLRPGLSPHSLSGAPSKASHRACRRSGGWQEWRDSNPRPSVLETDALPAELHS